MYLYRLLFFMMLSLPLFSSELNTTINLTESEKEYLKQHPSIRVHNELNWPPYNYNIDGKPQGFSIDYMNLLASKIGIKVEYISGYNWDEFLKMIKENKIDVMLNMAKTPEREKFLNFTSEYVKVIDTLFTKSDNNSYHKLEDLNGKTLALVEGFIAEELIKTNYPKIKILLKKNTLEALKAVAFNKADATLALFGVGNYFITTYNLSNIKPAFEIVDAKFNFNLHLATNKNNEILRDILEKGKKLITQDEVLLLRKKHIGNSSSSNNKILFTTSEIEYLKNREKVSICIDPNWMPFIGIKDNKHIGISADFMKLIEERVPIPIEVVKTKDWSEALNFAKEKKCDILPITMKTESRKEYLNFTTPYLQMPLVLAIHKDITFIDNIKNLKDKKIAIVKDFAFSEILKDRYPNLNIVEVSSIKDGLQKVESGEIFGFADTLASISYTSQNELIRDIKIGGKFNENYELSIAIRSGEAELLNIFEKLLNSISKDEKQHIINKWIAIKYEKGFDYSLFWKIIIVIFIVLTFMLYRHYILNRVNRDLEKRIKREIEKSREKDNLIFQQNKMASLGEMIGNIAHQWRQPLAQVSMIHNYLLTKLIDNNSVPKDVIEEIHKGQNVLQFMSKTISTFENFYSSSRDSFLVDEAVEKVFLILKESIYLNKIEVIKEINSKCKIDGDLNAFSQVILAIVQNSIYFLKIRGIKEPKIYIKIEQNDKFIELRVGDNAGGIKDENLEYIFEYGFSKRESDKNSTGIGLYIANLIIKEKFGGEIGASNRDNGAYFKILLPTKTN